MNGLDITCSGIANGMPGIAARLPYLFPEAVTKGRITLQRFVSLSTTNAAQTFGMTTKGSIGPGLDSDIAIWDPDATRTITLADQHDDMDYTPLRAWNLPASWKSP